MFQHGFHLKEPITFSKNTLFPSDKALGVSGSPTVMLMRAGSAVARMFHKYCEALWIRPGVPAAPSKEGGSFVFAAQQIWFIHKRLFALRAPAASLTCLLSKLHLLPLRGPARIRESALTFVPPFFLCFIVIPGLKISLDLLPHARWGIENTERFC